MPVRATAGLGGPWAACAGRGYAMASHFSVFVGPTPAPEIAYPLEGIPNPQRYIGKDHHRVACENEMVRKR